MPIYEYRCKACGRHVEVLQRVGEAPRRKCAECGGRLEKLVSRTAFLLKGGGWYSEGYTKSGGSDKGKKASSSGGEGKTESKGGGDSKSGGGGGGSRGGKRSASGLG